MHHSPTELHAQNEDSKTTLIKCFRLVPWRMYWYLCSPVLEGVLPDLLATWGWPLAGVSD